MSDLLQSGQHPDADQLNAFVEHVLPAHEREETLAHLAVCPHCRSIVALSLPSVEETAMPRPEPVRRPWLSGWNLAWPATAAVAALILGGIYIRNSFIVRNHVPPAQMAQSPAVKPAPASTLPPQTAQQSSVPRVAKIIPKQEAVTTLPISGRNIGRLKATGADSSAFQRQASNNSPQPSAGALASAAAAPSSTTVPVGAQSIQTENAAVAGTFALDQAQVISNHRLLPSGLPTVSAVTNGRQAVAIDAHNTLYLSDDAGGNWHVISPQWHGHAVKVELVSSWGQSGTSNSVGAVSPFFRAHISPSPPAAGSPASVDSAQSQKSSLSGEVTDQTGGVIPSASVVVTNSLTHAARTTKADGSGRYTVDNLDPGTYTLEAEAPGFKTQQLSGVALEPAQKSQMDLKLDVGGVSQSVEVQAEDQLFPTSFPGFEITTDTGEHWTSADGESWMRKTVEK